MLFADVGGLYADVHGFTRMKLLSSVPDLFQRLCFSSREILKIMLKEIRYKLSHIKYNF
jgi:hypothetical protein